MLRRASACVRAGRRSGRVVHYAGLAHGWRSGPVEELAPDRFAAGGGIEVKAVPLSADIGEEAVRRARSRLGEDRYRLLTNNCEHFCSWCLYGESHSEQVQRCLARPLMALRLLGAIAATWCRGLRAARPDAVAMPA